MSEFTFKAEVIGVLGSRTLKIKSQEQKQFHDLMRKLGDGRKVTVTVQYEDPRQEWIDLWYFKADEAESFGEVSFAFVKDGTVCISREQGDDFAVAAPRKGDKYDRKTGIAVAFAKFSGEKIPEYI